MPAPPYFGILKRVVSIKMQRHLGAKSLPYKYTFVVTNACNSRCKTCGVWKIYRDDPDVRNEELTADEIDKVIDSIRDSVLWLNFTGGEVSLRKDLPHVIRRAYDVCPNLSIINVPMNGLKTGRTVEFLEAFVPYCRDTKIYVTLSLDSTEKTYADIRGVDGFNQVMETFEALRCLQKRNPHFEVNFQLTVSRFNANSAAETFDFISEKSNLPIVTFAQRAALFNNDDMGFDHVVEDQEVRQALADIEHRYPVTRLDALMPKIFLILAQQYFRTGASPLPCSSGFSTITIDPYGEVMACPFYSGKTAGNVREFGCDLKAILKSKAARDMRAWASNCRDCWFNCEAIPSVMENIPLAMGKTILEKLIGLDILKDKGKK